MWAHHAMPRMEMLDAMTTELTPFAAAASSTVIVVMELATSSSRAVYPGGAGIAARCTTESTPASAEFISSTSDTSPSTSVAARLRPSSDGG